MKNLKYGVEIEFLGITREAAAEVVADFFGTGYCYEGGELNERDIADKDRRIWRVVRDASIDAYSDEEQCELVTPILVYDDLVTLVAVVERIKAAGGKVISVGTTSTRTLETIIHDHGEFKEASGFTDIFIYPGFEYKAVDVLITNFHLPESTLVMLVSALYRNGNDILRV